MSLNDQIKVWHLMLAVCVTVFPVMGGVVDLYTTVGKVVQRQEQHVNYIEESESARRQATELLVKISVQMDNMEQDVNDLKEQNKIFNKNIENFYYLNPNLKKPDL